MDLRFPDDTFFSDLAFSRFKLRLHKTDPLAPVPQQPIKHRQYQRQRDKRYVDGAEIQQLRDLLLRDVADVRPLQIHYPFIRPELPRQLPVAYVDGINPFRSMLEHTVGEPAGGRPDVGADRPGQIQLMGLDGLLELQAAPAHIGNGFPPDFHGCVLRNHVPGLFCLDTADINGPRHDECFRPLSTGSKPPIRQKNV